MGDQVEDTGVKSHRINGTRGRSDHNILQDVGLEGWDAGASVGRLTIVNG